MIAILPAFLSLIPPLALLKGTNLGGRVLERVYCAATDGWSALEFHANVDALGSTLIIGETATGARIGGYSPTGWESRDDYRATPNAFLFCAEPCEDEDELVWQRLGVLGPGDIAIFDYARGGPQFGAADLVIGGPKTPVMGGIAGPENDTPEYMERTAGDLRSMRSTLGGSYEKMPNGQAFPSGPLVELEAWANADFAPGGGLRVGEKASSRKAAGGDAEAPKVGWWPF